MKNSDFEVEEGGMSIYYDEDEEVKLINNNANQSALFKNSQLDESDWYFFSDKEWVETEEGTILKKRKKLAENSKEGITSVSKLES